MFFNVNDPTMLELDQEFERNGQAQAIRDVINTAYSCSLTFSTMVDDWFNCNQGPIKIKYAFNDFGAEPGSNGIIHIDLNYLSTAMYINNNGTAVKDTADTAIIHELVHALTGRRDNPDLILSGGTNDYRQPTVTHSNTIYRELGLTEQHA